MTTDEGEEGRSRSGRLQAAFDASFLTAAVLPAGLTLIRAPASPRFAAGEDVGADAGAVCHGQAIWLGQPDAPLYRLDDERWLLAGARRADALVRGLLEPASASNSAPGAVASVVRDDLRAGVLRITWLGPVVARLRLTPGEDATLPDDLPAELGRLAGAAVTRLAETAAELRRPWWRPVRWRHGRRRTARTGHPGP
ncbi:hypothetical protein [Frankia sp. AgKG'84/4]|uniref:hypothetical protein n=1 Tax=Frankia sp. AgKG'84/4 TaxID=573490 RepID=UPI00200FDCC4|nr:hypothetical protein [Frankia sp. AgKG'84/4]MCL9795670.1 hypothetical protein [Frankia sp. AgKG'84/4]